MDGTVEEALGDPVSLTCVARIIELQEENTRLHDTGPERFLPGPGP
ncbi:hypothetical protein [Nocardiopsis quinghaiensis]|nr:hypothetical protein [Nocardiopsis quinghaiensis]